VEDQLVHAVMWQPATSTVSCQTTSGLSCATFNGDVGYMVGQVGQISPMSMPSFGGGIGGAAPSRSYAPSGGGFGGGFGGVGGGGSSSSSGGTEIPEPSTVILWVLALGLFATQRWRLGRRA
jgi:hypothetical protein